MLGQNNPIAGFVHILPNAGLYLTQHCLECISIVVDVVVFVITIIIINMY